MIVGSFNVRGGGNALKNRRISDIIKKVRFLIQKTKLTKMNGFFLLRVCGVRRRLVFLFQIR